MTKQISFIVKGNQEKPDGNPIPYQRTTQASQWTDKARRYQEWKSYVVASYLDALEIIPKIDRADFGDAHDLIQKKPIKKTNKKIRVDIICYFADNSHADCDNIFKGIADALFMNDKYIAGSFDFIYPEDKKGKVEIKITFYDDEMGKFSKVPLSGADV